jgi:hypothetical protein
VNRDRAHRLGSQEHLTGLGAESTRHGRDRPDAGPFRGQLPSITPASLPRITPAPGIRGTAAINTARLFMVAVPGIPETTMRYTHVLNRGGLGVQSPVDRL